MHLVKVDVIHFQAAQAGLDFRHDMPTGEADLIGRDRLAHENVRVEADFGRDNQVFSTLAENTSENLLRRAGRINVGGVQEIAANLNKPI